MEAPLIAVFSLTGGRAKASAQARQNSAEPAFDAVLPLKGRIMPLYACPSPQTLFSRTNPYF